LRSRAIGGEGTVRHSSVHLFPVRIAAAAEHGTPSVAMVRPKPRRTGMIEMELSGDIRVSVEESVSAAALRRVMSVLRG
jgi:hypothetical protein